jgi:hypothetical protein
VWVLGFLFLSVRFSGFPYSSISAKKRLNSLVRLGRYMPCLALPCLALPCLALPCLALPCLALPCLALPYLTLPYLALPYPTLPCLTFPHIPFNYVPLFILIIFLLCQRVDHSAAGVGLHRSDVSDAGLAQLSAENRTVLLSHSGTSVNGRAFCLIVA